MTGKIIEAIQHYWGEAWAEFDRLIEAAEPTQIDLTDEFWEKAEVIRRPSVAVDIPRGIRAIVKKDATE